MEDEVQTEALSNEGGAATEPAPPPEPAKSVAEMLAAAKQAVANEEAARQQEAAKPEAAKQKIDISTPEIVKIERKAREPRPQGAAPAQGRREDRPPKSGSGPAGGGPGGGREPRGPGGERREGADRGDRRPAGEHRGPGGERREGGRPGGARPFDSFGEIELEKLVTDSLYLDNQAHAVVARMRDMDSGTKSQLRRLYNAVRRAVRAPESDRQHQFVMLRARLAYTIARHSLRSLDALERLLLQVTRRNDARGYERFKDLFEAIVAYNE
jgi:CRISPR type III-A-associated protein Csm2